MLTDVSLLSAFLVGLLGGVHCVGMCGGIVAALSMGLPESQRHGAARWKYLLAYNLARISSYTLAGALLGGVGWLAAHWSGVHQLQLGLQVIAALFMVALGLYLGGWWQGLAQVERIGGRVWAGLEPLGRRFLPVRSPGQAFLLGLVWGWLPCGLVYSVLVWSVSTGSPLQGAALLFSFGLGTLPNLLAMGVAAGWLSARVREARTRQLAGLLVILFGLYSLFRLIP
ncbi:MAG TPA: sulfite exporter TauE/SafE family protein [Gammaproteobacteria bacterium]|nr:sulfite exporter TauE/SafE family protein [Gammaproteobacteria bacterium]